MSVSSRCAAVCKVLRLYASVCLDALSYIQSLRLPTHVYHHMYFIMYRGGESERDIEIMLLYCLARPPYEEVYVWTTDAGLPVHTLSASFA